jgi:hypothetical protein
MAAPEQVAVASARPYGRPYIFTLVSAPPPSGPGRITPGQAWSWGLALVVVIALIVLFFLYGRHLRPLLGLA